MAAGNNHLKASNGGGGQKSGEEANEIVA